MESDPVKTFRHSCEKGNGLDDHLSIAENLAAAATHCRAEHEGNSKHPARRASPYYVHLRDAASCVSVAVLI